MSISALRRWAFGLTVVVAVLLLVSDWPAGFWQHFWLEHPLWAAMVAGLLLLMITAFGLDEYVRRRESRRWQVIGRVAAGEFHFGCSEAWVSMLELVGIVEITGQLSPAIQLRLDHARTVLAAHAEELHAIPATAQRARVLVVSSDPRWGAAAAPVLNAIAIELANAVSRWSAALLTLQDEEMFEGVNRFGRVGTDVSDLAAGLLPGVGESLTPAAVADMWMSLYDRFVFEDDYWRARFRGDAVARVSPGWAFTGDTR